MRHQVRIGEGLTDIGSSLVVQYSCLLLTRHLQTLVTGLIRCHFRLIWILVQNCLFISCKEPLLEGLSIDHRWSLQEIVSLHSHRCQIAMGRPDLEIIGLTVVFYAARRHSIIRLISHVIIITAHGVNPHLNFIETRQHYI